MSAFSRGQRKGVAFLQFPVISAKARIFAHFPKKAKGIANCAKGRIYIKMASLMAASLNWNHAMDAENAASPYGYAFYRKWASRRKTVGRADGRTK